MAITAQQVKALRAKTGLGLMDCKAALQEADGDEDKAIDVLRKRGLRLAESRAGRTTSEGIIGSYVHLNNKIGVLVEVGCESDFVARSDDFRQLVRDLCLQVAATNPVAVSSDDVPEAVKEREREIYRAQMAGKPDHVIEKAVEGKLRKFYEECCLLSQVFVKDADGKKTVSDVVTETIAKTGENVVVRRFVRMELGKD